MTAEEDRFDLSGALLAPQMPAHIYLHVPFCRIKCSYCDFYSTEDISSARIEMVLRGIEAELSRWERAALPGVLDTVYLGGGTPTVITGGAVRLVKAVADRFPIRTGAEITVEGNPDSMTRDLVEALAASGVTRMSIGVQSFAPAELAMLGRVHLVEESLKACENVVAAGLDLSIDLICAIPGQTEVSWISTLQQAVETGASHISVYPLSLEPGTPLAVACDAGLVEAADPDTAATHMTIAEEFLTAYGFPRYEVANYAKPGHESRHNLAYWTGRPYLGCGPAAHSMFDAATAVQFGTISAADAGRGVSRVRLGAPPDIDKWLTRSDVEIELLSAEETLREDVMLGLRLVRGVDAAAVTAARLDAVLESLEADGLVERVETPGRRGAFRWRTTRRGWLLGNEVFGRVWAGE